MDPEPQQQPASSVNNKPSAIPRPSRLPVLRNRSSQSYLPKPEGTIDVSKQPNATPRLQKRSSIASFSRPSQPASRSTVVPTKPLAKRSSGLNGSKHVSKSSTGTTSSLASRTRPSSRGNEQRHPPPATKSVPSPEDEENHDQLSSLDSFRAASRQGSREDVTLGPEEYVEPPELQPSKAAKKSRPSLSDRTIESLQNIPSTPKDRRRSSFFSPVESPMGPPPRPGSSSSRNGSSGGSRPGTSDGNFGRSLNAYVSTTQPASAKPASRKSLNGFGFVPSSIYRRTSTKISRTDLSNGKNSVPQSPAIPRHATPSVAASAPSSEQHAAAKPTSKKLGTAKALKPRPSLSDAFGSAVQAGAVQDAETETHQTPTESPKATKASKKAVASPSNASSAALRQQIAAAKAAARKEKAKHDSTQEVSIANGTGFDVDKHDDPFNQAPKDGKHILRNRIKTARMDGKLNIAAMGLKQIPDEVMKMYDTAAMEESNVSWAEVVDLTKLIAADNEIKNLDDDIFPDRSPEEFEADDQTQGNQFGGLEALDLHGNSLLTLPMGLRRLERLTNLNLVHNKLENGALDVISQIACLKDLRLGHNALSGTLPASLCALQHLETLDLQSNRLLGLPEAVRDLVNLKVLNMSGNQLTTLPMEALQGLHLTELDASSNALIGSVFPLGTAASHPTLQTLKVANNSLAALTFSETLDLPQLQTLDVTNNHLTGLPSVSGWKELITLMAGDNKITELPSDFAMLRKLRNVNFTSNEIRLLDPHIGLMESLESLILASNPLREKKFLTMNAADTKRDLKSRLEPSETEAVDSPEREMYHDARDCISPSVASPSSSWTLKPHGALDLAGRGLSDSINDSLGSFLQSNEVKQMQLQGNLFTAVPPALWLGQDLKILNLSGNALGSDYLSDELDLPALQELNVSRCGITTLEPLMTQLRAPGLQILNITANRLYGDLPSLRTSYPALLTLLAGDNKFSSINAESLRGLHTVNLASNNIEQLPAEVGLLWDEGLRSLEIGANAFRVPNYRILEKGTEATLRWLRDRLPAGQGAPVVNGGLIGNDELD